ALHHFLSAALFSVLVFGRVLSGRQARMAWRGAAVAGCIVAAGLALPRSFEVDRSHRRIAAEIDYRAGNYSGHFRDWSAAFRSAEVLAALFPDTVDSAVAFTGAHAPLFHYAATLPQPRP